MSACKKWSAPKEFSRVPGKNQTTHMESQMLVIDLPKDDLEDHDRIEAEEDVLFCNFGRWGRSDERSADWSGDDCGDLM